MGNTRLAAAQESCTGGELADEDRTLVLDMKGKEAGSGNLTVEDVVCVLGDLEAPTSVVTLMEQTRALDGRQTAEWDGIDANWSYHPDSGLDVVLTEP